MMKKETNEKINFFQMLFLGFTKFLKQSPIYIILTILLTVVFGVFSGMYNIVLQKVFDTVTLYSTGDLALKSAILVLVGFLVYNFLQDFFENISHFGFGYLIWDCNEKLYYEIHNKFSEVSPIDYEKTEKLNDIEKAKRGLWCFSECMLLVVIVVAFQIPYFIVTSYFLYSIKPIFIFILFLCAIPSLYSSYINYKIISKMEDKAAPIRRENSFYEQAIVDRQFFKETRILGGFKKFKKSFEETFKILTNLEFKANLKTNLYKLSVYIFNIFCYLFTLGMLFNSLMKKEITVGSFAVVLSAIEFFFYRFDSLFENEIKNIIKNLPYLNNYFRFLKSEKFEGEDINIPENFDIILENVSFKYPMAEKNALNDISFKIKNKETIAIVGENGSGKSTLIRIISGIYKLEEGSVKYGNVDIKKVSNKSLFSNITAVFQKFAKYKLTLEENIKISDFNLNETELYLDNVAKESGFSKDDECFNNGYETMLSKEFNGVDLSGGLWQRVAIARGLFRKHKLIILDEPTSAIDPFEETRIYNHFAKVSKNKTAIIVTHRLGSVKLADRIVVLKEGRVVKIGTHEELINQNGEYKRMYESQQKWYE